MARLPRIIVPGLPLHIIQRGNNKQATFFSADGIKGSEHLNQRIQDS